MKNIDTYAVAIDGHEMKDVDLGARLSKHGGAEDDIKSNLGKGAAAFNKFAKIWRSGQLSKNTKNRIFKSPQQRYSTDARLEE